MTLNVGAPPLSSLSTFFVRACYLYTVTFCS